MLLYRKKPYSNDKLLLAGFLLFVLLFMAERGVAGQTQSSPESGSPDLFKRYEDAFNRHDHEAVASFWALDPAYMEKALPRWKGEREFEAATNAVFRISARALGGDAFEVTQREDCDFYSGLGTGTKTSTFVVHLRDGKFHDVQRGASTDAGGDYDQRKADFRNWILKNRPAQATTVTDADDFIFNGKTGPIIMDLIRQWRAATNDAPKS
jgi:ketosteroid isomerase-like protein